MATLRSILAVLLTALVLTASGTLATGTTAGAQEPTTTVVPLPEQEQRSPSIIPIPNSGREPVADGDPGSASQYAVLFATMGGMIVIGLLIARESRRKRDLRTPAPTAAPSGPAAGAEKVDAS